MESQQSTYDDVSPYLLQYNTPLSAHRLSELATPGRTITLCEHTRQRVKASRAMLDRFVAEKRVIYGVNTSLGGFVHMLVPVSKAPQLQANLLKAAATNVGPYFDTRTTRATMLARIVSLARGNSAISLDNLQVLVEMFNAGITPCIPEKGSLGTSGDLGPLATIALVGCGQWRARYQGQELPGAQALSAAGITPMQLGYKEGLALINGTSAMVGLGTLLVQDAMALLDAYIDVSALAMEALGAKTKPFDPRVHALKPHRGQREVAHRLWNNLADSGLARSERAAESRLASEMRAEVQPGGEPIEDAYSIRCTPQVLGPVLDAMRSVQRILEDELNSSNDNPLIIPEEDEVFHNGHFHGQYVAMAMDQLAVALVVLCNLSDRRVDRLLTASNSNGLPAFLCKENPGLRLGLMGGQFMSTSLTAENRSLAVPLSIQTLPSTGDFQDVVSFGLVAARRVREILHNTRYIMAFEALCACQAVDIRGVQHLSHAGRRLYERTRAIVPYLDEDCPLTDYLEALVAQSFSKEDM